MSQGYRIGTLRRKRPDRTSYRHFVMHWTDAAGSHRVSLCTDDRPTVEATACAIWTKHTVASVDTVDTVDTVGDVMTAWLAATTEEKGHKRATEAWRAARPFWDRVGPGMIDAAMCRS